MRRGVRFAPSLGQWIDGTERSKSLQAWAHIRVPRLPSSLSSAFSARLGPVPQIPGPRCCSDRKIGRTQVAAFRVSLERPRPGSCSISGAGQNEFALSQFFGPLPPLLSAAEISAGQPVTAGAVEAKKEPVCAILCLDFRGRINRLLNQAHHHAGAFQQSAGVDVLVNGVFFLHAIA